MDHSRALPGHLPEVLRAHPVYGRRGGHDLRVGGEDALHRLVETDAVTAQRSCQAHRGRIAPSPAKRRHAAVGARSLEAGHHHAALSLEQLQYPCGIHLLDARVLGAAVGAYAGLPSGERPGADSPLSQQRSHHDGGDHLAAGEQQVHLTRLCVRDQPLQRIGRVGIPGAAHRRDHDHQPVALPEQLLADAHHGKPGIVVGQAGSSEFHHRRDGRASRCSGTR